MSDLPLNRVVITLNERGDLVGVCADSPVQVLINCPSCPADRVYEYEAAIGPQHVQREIGGYPVGHAYDGTLGIGDGTGKRPPSKPPLRLVLEGKDG